MGLFARGQGGKDLLHNRIGRVDTIHIDEQIIMLRSGVLQAVCLLELLLEELIPLAQRVVRFTGTSSVP